MQSATVITRDDDLFSSMTAFVAKTRRFFPELGDFVFKSLSLRLDSPPPSHLFEFLLFLVTRVNGILAKNVPPGDFTVTKEHYNPPKYGRAYYFTEDGQRMRTTRGFSIHKKTSVNFDDVPDANRCQKSFPMVAKKGTTYLFLWFCPVHGHCYGFHIIPNSEGRKDAATSLYGYLEDAPETIFMTFLVR